jgi:hypothetical protein
MPELNEHQNLEILFVEMKFVKVNFKKHSFRIKTEGELVF